MVVLLMVLYYIIFSGIDVSGLTVAVIGFTLPFGAGMYGMLCTGVNAVGRSPQEAYDRGMELLKRVGLAHAALKYPDQESGGQKQRIAIARVLAMDPEVILFDEPTSAPDPRNVKEVQSVIKDLVDAGRTMMIVTHDLGFARSASNRVF